MSDVCPAGHRSDEPDYCSVCGARMLPAASSHRAIDPARSAAAPSQRAFVSRQACPMCGDLREDPDARFCEVCRYDFRENRPGPPPVARSVPRPAPAPAPVPVPAPARAWDLVITVDPTLDTDPDPGAPCPRGVPAIVLPVDEPDMLVGRHDETRAIHPDVSLRDPGASRRHARFVLGADGGVSLQDLASTNGTRVNGEEVPPGARRRLADGDSVTLGRWTRITLRGRA